MAFSRRVFSLKQPKKTVWSQLHGHNHNFFPDVFFGLLYVQKFYERTQNHALNILIYPVSTSHKINISET